MRWLVGRDRIQIHGDAAMPNLGSSTREMEAGLIAHTFHVPAELHRLGVHVASAKDPEESLTIQLQRNC